MDNALPFSPYSVPHTLPNKPIYGLIGSHIKKKKERELWKMVAMHQWRWSISFLEYSVPIGLKQRTEILGYGFFLDSFLLQLLD